MNNEIIDDVQARFKKVIDEQFDGHVESIVLSTELFEDLGTDSLEGMEFIMAIEEEFDIDIPDEDLDAITTVQLAIEYIRGRL